MNYKIVFDLNGNDNGQASGIAAAKQFAKQNPNFQISLIGDFQKKSDLELTNISNIKLLNNPTTPTNPKDLRGSMMEKTSMNQAIDLLKNKEADAILSSGDSGCYISSLTFKIGRLNNVSRPAFMPICNAINGQKFLFMDVGANLVAKSDFLVEWAKLGSAFYEVMFNKPNPSVALLNIGTEDYKGNENAVEANKILKEDSNLNYVGFNETRDLFRGLVDVAVIDGYGGNLVLKSYEGAIFTFKDLLKEKFTKTFLRKLHALALKKAFKEAGDVLDYRQVGSAWVIGIDGIAIKAHGSSDTLSYLSALNTIKTALEKDLLNKLKDKLND
ncbi:phosphate acyltransferase PlsX [Mycoplasma buteonis]|uniref:phosphate acyltransferase PlsX n=1 Tax=Mycoplasma buteonis TaxID=171280 RepID=UPI000564B96D|nr:phosphate acyltransferase PlsX [Mycoplasma buteonis]